MLVELMFVDMRTLAAMMVARVRSEIGIDELQFSKCMGDLAGTPGTVRFQFSRAAYGWQHAAMAER